MTQVLNTVCSSDECLRCESCNLVFEKDGRLFWMYCEKKEKQFFFGKMIGCDDFKLDKENEKKNIKEMERERKKYERSKKNRENTNET